MNELFENFRAGSAKRLGEFAVITTMAATGYLGVHWMDDRIDARLSDRLPELEQAILGCATAADCQRRGDEIKALDAALDGALARVRDLERYVDKHEEGSNIYKRKIDICCDRPIGMGGSQAPSRGLP